LAPDAAVVHMAWTTIPATSNADPGADAEDNVLGSIRLWEACAARRVGRVIFLSSGGTVYGNAQRIPIREDDPTEPICAYGVSKLAAEKYLGLFHGLHGLDHVVLRPGNAYGPGQDPGRGQSAATVFAYRAFRNEPITIWGDGSATRDLLYVEDLADAVVRALAYDPGADGPRVFNVGTGRGTSLKELAEVVGLAAGRVPQVRYAPGRATDVTANVLDASRLRERTGWEPRVALAEGIARMLQAWRATEAHPNAVGGSSCG
ncbi:MAG: NAD-dependent epimerase/dehydratase family protein, partial [Zetaproteobacteria bacterium]